MEDRVVSDLPDLLHPGDLLVVNRTRVRRARLHGVKSSGGAVELLLLGALGDGRWQALARPARRLRPGLEIEIAGAQAVVDSEVDDGRVVVQCDQDLGVIAEEAGEIPLPPYFHGVLDDDDRYQTVFADILGSAAAPTAALHFTRRLTHRLERRGIGLARVELEVGLDSFRPISAAEIEDHRMHSERIRVEASAARLIGSAREQGGRIVAVGTTVVRTLEAAWQRGEVQPFTGATDLFITPGHQFRAVDLVVTNFHVPGSTLVVLVAALLGSRWRFVYETALQRGYRFLSFGDAMLAEVPR